MHIIQCAKNSMILNENLSYLVWRCQYNWTILFLLPRVPKKLKNCNNVLYFEGFTRCQQAK